MALRDDRLSEETDFARLKWVKSSASTGDADADDACVEVSAGRDLVFVRDSKAPGPILGFTPAAWKAFIEGPLGD
ncbi:DUF397 domain-containing protein [Amycolatopsis sp. lyj-84]|uniref:DUF397 domain-containing protein n=1 Tax=Amycolatopsis sp. lyj-84 TaxID=2789284 RepID=UPI00397BDF46